MKSGMHCFVTGKVQGVWFRASTKEQAEALGLTGFVRNLADGRVEVIACGDDEQLAQLRAWLAVGPELAKVTSVEEEKIEWREYSGFRSV